MPPSISSRQSPQAVPHDDDTSPNHAQQRQAVTDFQARKQLLASGEKKKSKKKREKASSKNSVQVTKQAPVESSTVQPSSTLPDQNSNVLAGNGMNYGMGGGGYGMGMGGMMGYGMGMYGGMGMGGGMGMMPGPLGGLNQFLFGIQATILSLGQAVQVLGMNTHAMHQLLDTASSMMDHALATWHEMRALEANTQENESEDQKKRRRRLKALRWALLVGATYAAYRLLRSIFSARRRSRRRRLTSDMPPATGYGMLQNSPGAMTSPYSSQYGGGYNNVSPYYGSSYGNGSMYGGGAYGGPFY